RRHPECAGRGQQVPQDTLRTAAPGRAIAAGLDHRVRSVLSKTFQGPEPRLRADTAWRTGPISTFRWAATAPVFPCNCIIFSCLMGNKVVKSPVPWVRVYNTEKALFFASGWPRLNP